MGDNCFLPSLSYARYHSGCQAHIAPLSFPVPDEEAEDLRPSEGSHPKVAFLTLPLNSAWTGHLETTNSTWRPRGAPAYTQKHQSQLLKVESMPTRLTGSQFQQAPLQENK